MKTGRTIQEMAVEIQRQSDAKADYLVNTGRLQMADWDGQPMLHLLGENGEDQMEPLEVLSTAHRQLGRTCSRRTPACSPTTSTAGFSGPQNSA